MLIKLLMTINVFLYRLTNGVIGGKMGGQSVLLLHTIGRKSGKSYITPTNYFRDGKNYVLVASNWGKANNPAWFINLMNRPETIIEVKAQRLPVRARSAKLDEYERLWTMVTQQNAYYVRYQSQIKRKIPLIILAPSDSPEEFNRN